MIRHVQVTRTSPRGVAITIGDMQREVQYLSYNQLDSHRTGRRALIGIRDNITPCVSCGDESARPPAGAGGRLAWLRPIEAPADTMEAHCRRSQNSQLPPDHAEKFDALTCSWVIWRSSDKTHSSLAQNPIMYRAARPASQLCEKTKLTNWMNSWMNSFGPLTR